MQYCNITTDAELKDYCRDLEHCPAIHFDTEFVSEHTFRPVLCLVQVAAGGALAIIDPLSIEDMTPFWEVLIKPGHETIVHAGRGEVEFCMHAVGKMPHGLFDVQIAAAFVGIEYPAGYATLLSKLLGEKSKKHETRTDWRHRPLSKKQIEYALKDAHYLPMLHETLEKRLRELGRFEWFRDEMSTWEHDVRKALSHERWRRVSGNAGLDARELAILRELFLWREKEAQRRNQPVRRVLRDDLIVELARRGTDDVKQIRALRGMERGDLLKRMEEIAACIHNALELTEDQLPPKIHVDQMPQLSVLGQFLFAALGSLCRESHLAPTLVGTPNDIRELITFRAGGAKNKKVPRLARGWRELFVGRLFEELLSGRIAVRIANPNDEAPLLFEKSRNSKVD